MSTEKLAKVFDVIEHGETIPANVVRVRDKVGDPWRRRDDGWVVTEYRGEPVLMAEQETVTPLREPAMQRFWAPLTVVEVAPEPQPAEDDEPVHYVISEFGPSGATLCGLGIEEDGNLLTTGEAGKGTCRDCRIAVDEEPARLSDKAIVDDLVAALHVEPDQIVAEVEALRAALYEARQPAEPGPLVLILPQVPAEAVALIDVNARRWTRSYETVGGDQTWHTDGPYGNRSVGELLADGFGPLVVELTPPREPRTWPKLDVISDDVKTVRGASGKVYDRSHYSQSVPVFRERGEDGTPTGPGHMFHALQTFDGPLSEVIEP